MDIQETPFTEALLDDIESHPCIAAASRDIDGAWEDFLNQASCHFHPELDEHCLTQAEFDARYGELPW